MSISEELNNLSTNLWQELEICTDLKSLENFRIKALGKKAQLSLILRQLGSLSPEERKILGQAANDLRQKLEKELVRKIDLLASAVREEQMQKGAIDISLPSKNRTRASLHPLTQVIEEIENIFLGMGYLIATGPEVEWVKYNFDRLRIQEGHPARDEKDTFYISDNKILRTQTSPVQIRVMEKTRPPIKIIAPGKVYRPDTADATHNPVFHQIEGLVVDKGITMGDLVGTLKLFARQLFGEKTEIRLRPHHFPFTEPSCEVDVSCWTCGGKGCPTCKHEGFIEILGAGMVHPWVLEQCGIDSDIYSGFAFGIGVERTAMARFGINDIRNFYENNLQFLKQFK